MRKEVLFLGLVFAVLFIAGCQEYVGVNPNYEPDNQCDSDPCSDPSCPGYDNSRCESDEDFVSNYCYQYPDDPNCQADSTYGFADGNMNLPDLEVTAPRDTYLDDVADFAARTSQGAGAFEISGSDSQSDSGSSLESGGKDGSSGEPELTNQQIAQRQQSILNELKTVKNLDRKEQLLKEILSLNLKSAEVIKAIKDILAEPLTQALPNLQLAALQALTNADSKQALPYLTESLKNSNDEIREGAIDIIGDYRLKEGLTLLPSLLQDSVVSVRAEAVRTLGEIGYKYGTAESVPVLIPLLKDSDRTVRSTAGSNLALLSHVERGSYNSNLAINALSQQTDISYNTFSNPNVQNYEQARDSFLDSALSFSLTGSETAIQSLLSKLEDSSDGFVRGTLALEIEQSVLLGGEPSLDDLRILENIADSESNAYARENIAEAVDTVKEALNK